MDVSFLEKVFISHFGAIKPPWIHKEVFYKLPFNFCDRWCERCKLSKICRVYQKEKESEKRFIKQGIDPKSSEAMFISMTESFEETPKEIKEPLKILNYYMLFFSVKIHRAIFSNVEEKEMKHEDSTFDSKNSAFLSYVSIVKIINALKNISNYKNLDGNLNKKVTKYLSLFENLNLVLKERFELEY